MLLGIPELTDAIEVNATVGVAIRDQFLFDRLSIDIAATALRREHAQATSTIAKSRLRAGRAAALERLLKL